MDFEDRSDFAKKMIQIASVVGRAIDDIDIEAYFNQLAEYPLDLVCRAFDRALRDRDYEDMYLATLIPTDGEVRRAISAIIMEDRGPGAKIGCEKCNETGMVIEEREDGSTYARRCECLLAAIEAKKKYGSREKKL